MYEEFFRLSSPPFRLNPDPKFFFGSRSHNKAMAYLHYGLRQAEGFIVITGEIGAGKSMLIGHLIDQLERSNVVAAHLLLPNLEPSALLAHLLSAFHIEPSGEGPAADIEAFEDFLYDQMNRGRRVLVIIDEAQNLPVATLEELRVLSNLNYDGTPLFQVFLIGQPDFRNVLAGQDLEQLRQRIIASYHLTPLDADETRAYIEHRLRLVGWEGDPSFSDQAYEFIHDATQGIPRRINKVCNRIMLSCALDARHKVTGGLVRQVIDDLAAEDPAAASAEFRLSPLVEPEDAPPGPVQTDKVAAPAKAAEARASHEPKDTGPVLPKPVAIDQSASAPGGVAPQPDPDAVAAPPDAGGLFVTEPERRMPVPISDARPTAPLSVLDRLRAKRSIRNGAATHEPAPTPATLNELAMAIAAVDGVGADSDASPSNGHAPVPSADRSAMAVWGPSVVRTINEAREDLKLAHRSIALIRSRLVEIEERRYEVRTRIGSSLERAEALLSELRDAWR